MRAFFLLALLYLAITSAADEFCEITPRFDETEYACNPKQCYADGGRCVLSQTKKIKRCVPHVVVNGVELRWSRARRGSPESCWECKCQRNLVPLVGPLKGGHQGGEKEGKRKHEGEAAEKTGPKKVKVKVEWNGRR